MAAVASGLPDSNPADNIAIEVTTIRDVLFGDLGVALPAGQNPVAHDNLLELTVTVTNATPEPVAGAFITLPLPSGAVFFASDCPACSPMGTTVLCNLFELPALSSTSVVLTLGISTNAPPGSMQASVSVTITNDTPNTALRISVEVP